MQFTPHNWCVITLHQVSASAHSYHLHAIHGERLIVCCLCPRSDLHSSFHVDSAKGNTCCAFAQWGVLPPGDIHSSHRLWAQGPWRLPLFERLLKWSSKYGALVLVWRGTRRWACRKSAIFTTVHSGARRTSGPKTSLSLSWRKIVSSPVLFCVSFKNGETHART